MDLEEIYKEVDNMPEWDKARVGERYSEYTYVDIEKESAERAQYAIDNMTISEFMWNSKYDEWDVVDSLGADNLLDAMYKGDIIEYLTDGSYDTELLGGIKEEKIVKFLTDKGYNVTKKEKNG